MAYPLSRKDVTAVVVAYENAHRTHEGTFQITARRPVEHQPAVITTNPEISPRKGPTFSRLTYRRKRI